MPKSYPRVPQKQIQAERAEAPLKSERQPGEEYRIITVKAPVEHRNVFFMPGREYEVKSTLLEQEIEGEDGKKFKDFLIRDVPAV